MPISKAIFRNVRKINSPDKNKASLPTERNVLLLEAMLSSDIGRSGNHGAQHFTLSGRTGNTLNGKTGLLQHAHVLHRIVAYDKLGLGKQLAEQRGVAAEGRGVLYAFRRDVVNGYRIVPFRLVFRLEILVVYDGVPAVDDGNLQNFAVGGKVGHFDVDGVDAAGVEGTDEVLDLRG